MADNTKGATGSSCKARKGIGSVEESSERNGTKSKKGKHIQRGKFSLGGGSFVWEAGAPLQISLGGGCPGGGCPRGRGYYARSSAPGSRFDVVVLGLEQSVIPLFETADPILLISLNLAVMLY